jgi:hypothetical protein
MRLAERLVEADGVVALDETGAERRGKEILGISLTLLEDVLALDDLGDVLGDGGIRPCEIEPRSAASRAEEQ